MTITDILDKFPYKEFELNPNKPTYASIKDINENSVPTPVPSTAH